MFVTLIMVYITLTINLID